MKYVVDEIIDDIIKVENLETRKIEYLKDFEVVGKVKDGDCLVKKDEFYYLDSSLKEERKLSIAEKLAKIKKYD